MEIIIIILVYIISVIAAWYYIHLSHNTGGIYVGMEIGFQEILICITPVINTLFSLIGYISYYPIVSTKPKKEYSKFFNIKK